jgi:hypothetical protein
VPEKGWLEVLRECAGAGARAELDIVEQELKGGGE